MHRWENISLGRTTPQGIRMHARFLVEPDAGSAARLTESARCPALFHHLLQ